jgi:glycosyltransferase involved in cell wall biosynthesis
MQVLICLPARNEEKILLENVNKVWSFLNSNNWPFNWEIVLTINGSNDNSISIANYLANKLGKQVKVLEIKKKGKGRAIKYCFDKFKNRDILVYMDIDLAVSLNNLNFLLEPLLDNKADLIIGSRLLKKAQVKRSFFRSFVSRVYNFLSQILLKHQLSDLQCGFKAIKAETYKTIRPYLEDNYWFFDTEWIVFAKHFNFKIEEIPVDWQDNRYQTRKSGIKVLKDGWELLKSLYNLKRRLKIIKKISKD